MFSIDYLTLNPRNSYVVSNLCQIAEQLTCFLETYQRNVFLFATVFLTVLYVISVSFEFDATNKKYYVANQSNTTDRMNSVSQFEEEFNTRCV